MAKAGIYVVFSLSLFAFLMFVHGARQFSAAGAVAAEASAAPLAGESASAVAHPGAGAAVPAATAPPEASGASTPQEEALKHESTVAFEDVTPAPQAIVANVYGKEVDTAALQAELARMAALGFSFSDGLSADYVGEFYATSYCAEAYPHICGGNGVTASGTAPIPGLTCASDWGVLPPGTWIYIGGVGIRRVEDSGGAIKGARLDVVVDTHANALAWRGQGNHDVWILA